MFRDLSKVLTFNLSVDGCWWVFFCKLRKSWFYLTEVNFKLFESDLSGLQEILKLSLFLGQNLNVDTLSMMNNEWKYEFQFSYFSKHMQIFCENIKNHHMDQSDKTFCFKKLFKYIFLHLIEGMIFTNHFIT